jgi:hypothetical protein
LKHRRTKAAKSSGEPRNGPPLPKQRCIGSIESPFLLPCRLIRSSGFGAKLIDSGSRSANGGVARSDFRPSLDASRFDCRPTPLPCRCNFRSTLCDNFSGTLSGLSRLLNARSHPILRRSNRLASGLPSRSNFLSARLDGITKDLTIRSNAFPSNDLSTRENFPL